MREGGEVEGCHASRTDAIKQQRALYSNESRMASMYAELDAVTEEYVEEVVAEAPQEVRSGSELVKIVVGNEAPEKDAMPDMTGMALTASLALALEAMNNRLSDNERVSQSMVAALEGIAMGQANPPVVHVAAPNVSLEPVFEVPSPTVNIAQPDIHVPAPQVTVRPEIVLPNVTKTITFDRDPLDGRITQAEVSERSEP